MHCKPRSEVFFFCKTVLVHLMGLVIYEECQRITKRQHDMLGLLILYSYSPGNSSVDCLVKALMYKVT